MGSPRPLHDHRSGETRSQGAANLTFRSDAPARRSAWRYPGGTACERCCDLDCRCALISATDRPHATANDRRTATRSGSWQRLAAAEQIPDNCQGCDQQHAHDDAAPDAAPQAYGFRPRQLYRQPTRGGFSTVGTIVTIHRCGLRDRSSWTDRTMPKNLDPFKLSSAARPPYWARRQRVASRKLLVSTVCTMTSSGQAAHSISQNIN